MSTLYKLVEDILNESSIDVARQKLYGFGGVNIDGTEYYERVISQFVRKKDLILRKYGQNIYYDLDVDIKDIWDIVFISQYVYKCWEQEQAKLRRELSRLKSINQENDEIKGKIAEINQNVALINTYFQKISRESELSKIRINGLSLTDQINIDNEILELKKAIIVIQKIRDSFEHRNSHLKLGKMIEIDNEKNNFRVIIPSDYIDGFSKGRIMARDEDKELVFKTNSITYPLLHELNYDPKKLESFFYNIDPQYLSYLLELVGNDIKKLYQLPSFIFDNRCQNIINKFIQSNISLEEISTIPIISNNMDTSFIPYFNDGKDIDNCIELINYCKQNDIDYTKITNSGAFTDAKKTISLLSNGITIEELNLLTIGSSYITDYCSRDIEQLRRCQNLGINLSEIPKIYKGNVDHLIKLIESGFTIETISRSYIGLSKIKMPVKGFAQLIVPSSKDTQYLKEQKIDINSLSLVALRHIAYVVELLKMGFDLKIINELSETAMVNFNKIQYLIDNGISLEVINLLPLVAYDNVESTIKIITTLRKKGYNNFSSVEPGIFSSRVELDKICEFIKCLRKDEVEFFVTSKILSHCYLDSKIFDEIIELKNNLWSKDFKCLDIIGENATFYEGDSELIEIVFNLCKKHDVDISIMKYIPFRIVQFVGNRRYDNVDIEYRYEKSIFDLIQFFLVRGINIDKPIPEKIFNVGYDLTGAGGPICNYKYDNLSILLDVVDNDYSKLDIFPSELFSCEINLLNELLIKYNTNICKSIFGIDNPKIVASLIYVNSVLSRIDKNTNFDDVDFNPMNFIDSTQNDTINFIGVTTNNDIPIENIDYVSQFIIDDRNGERRDFSSIKSFIINKLRNSIAHFRFKSVKDNEGNIIEDKLYLYDEYNDGTNNFNIIINLQDLINIVRQVETGLYLDSDEIEHSVTIKK